MFTESDKVQLKKRGIETGEVLRQIQYFKNGIDYINILKPSIPGDGIEKLSDIEEEELVALFDRTKDELEMVKFVPASGAASRMFKELFEAFHFFRLQKSDSQKYLKDHPGIKQFFDSLPDYPFFEDLIKALEADGKKINDLLTAEDYETILEYILHDAGLNYGELPKGLLRFHRYQNDCRTAFQEHYEEAIQFLTGSEKKINLHFTVSPEHEPMFQDLSNELTRFYNEEKGIHFSVNFSVQKHSTNTLSVDLDNEPFRTPDGELLFRPGGHGALLENLNDLKESIVFISNIDNVAPDRLKSIRAKYKKFLGGFLIRKVRIIHDFLKRVNNGELTESLKTDIINFVKDVSPEDADLLSQASDIVFRENAHRILNRPVRVCGMVKNTGEPGGGPFWVQEKNNRSSKQIVESSQVDLSHPGQKEIFDLSTHFNPVDLVCYIHDYEGNKFNLREYRDPDLGFISEKSFGGMTIKALELPGLWNGSMAGWISYFVNVPGETFSPVKTVFDLVRSEHR